MAAAFAWMGGILVAIFAAIVLTTAIRRVLPVLEAALGLSMFAMGFVLHMSGFFSGSGPWPVFLLVAVSHAVAGWAIWQRERMQRS
jgi:ABC-type iron transport system FetAB permease component